jgi:hypothetical protein
VQNRIKGAVSLGYGIVSDFVFCFNCPRSEARKNRARGFDGGVDAFQY